MSIKTESLLLSHAAVLLELTLPIVVESGDQTLTRAILELLESIKTLKGETK